MHGDDSVISNNRSWLIVYRRRDEQCEMRCPTNEAREQQQHVVPVHTSISKQFSMSARLSTGFMPSISCSIVISRDSGMLRSGSVLLRFNILLVVPPTVRCCRSDSVVSSTVGDRQQQQQVTIRIRAINNTRSSSPSCDSVAIAFGMCTSLWTFSQDQKPRKLPYVPYTYTDLAVSSASVSKRGLGMCES